VTAPPPPAPIRPARPGEAGAVRDLVRASYARWVPLIGQEPGPMRDDYAARIAAGEAFVMDGPDGAPLGVLVLEDDPPEALLLDNVALAPAAQGQGLGRALMGFAEAEARRRGRPAIRLYTNAAMETNIRLYERLGYAVTRRAREAGFDRVFMEKRLP
jgi:ribosomal protein S18 acetylase RimI-like enzyme